MSIKRKASLLYIYPLLDSTMQTPSLLPTFALYQAYNCKGIGRTTEDTDQIYIQLSKRVISGINVSIYNTNKEISVLNQGIVNYLIWQNKKVNNMATLKCNIECMEHILCTWAFYAHELTKFTKKSENIYTCYLDHTLSMYKILNSNF
jgi:hypothetical protein